MTNCKRFLINCSIVILLILFQSSLIGLKSNACEIDSDCIAGQYCNAGICTANTTTTTILDTEEEENLLPLPSIEDSPILDLSNNYLSFIPNTVKEKLDSLITKLKSNDSTIVDKAFEDLKTFLDLVERNNIDLYKYILRYLYSEITDPQLSGRLISNLFPRGDNNNNNISNKDNSDYLKETIRIANSRDNSNIALYEFSYDKLNSTIHNFRMEHLETGFHVQYLINDNPRIILVQMFGSDGKLTGWGIHDLGDHIIKSFDLKGNYTGKIIYSRIDDYHSLTERFDNAGKLISSSLTIEKRIGRNPSKDSYETFNYDFDEKKFKLANRNTVLYNDDPNDREKDDKTREFYVCDKYEKEHLISMHKRLILRGITTLENWDNNKNYTGKYINENDVTKYFNEDNKLIQVEKYSRTSKEVEEYGLDGKLISKTVYRSNTGGNLGGLALDQPFIIEYYNSTERLTIRETFQYNSRGRSFTRKEERFETNSTNLNRVNTITTDINGNTTESNVVYYEGKRLRETINENEGTANAKRTIITFTNDKPASEERLIFVSDKYVTEARIYYDSDGKLLYGTFDLNLARQRTVFYSRTGTAFNVSTADIETLKQELNTEVRFRTLMSLISEGSISIDADKLKLLREYGTTQFNISFTQP